MNNGQNIPQGYKKTTIGFIPQGWEVKRLELLCSNKGDYGINAPAVTYSEDLPTYLRITDIDDDGRFITANKTSVNSSNSEYFHMQEGDIVFARTGATVGKTYLYNPNDGDLVFAGFLIRFSPDKQKIIPYFLRAYTNTTIYWHWVKIISQRSGQPGINAAEYCSLQIPVPPLAEQQKIAEVLGTWDKAIEKQTQLIRKFELRKKGLMQQLLTGKKRMLGFFGPWKKVRLKEIFIEGSKIPVDSTSRYKKISIGLYKKGISYVDDNKVKADIRPFYVREKGEIIIGKQNYFNGSIAIVNDKFDGTICSNAIMSFRVKNLFNLKFIYEAISQPDYLKKREMMANGTGQKELSEKDFLNFDIVVPSFEEQIAIAQILTAADREIELEQQKLELLRQQKRGLMQQLLTGKKRVKL